MSKRKEVHKRAWLCPGDPDAMSYMAYTMDLWDDASVSLTLADCTRSINLHCSGRKGVAKLNRLIKFIQEARDELEDNL